MTCRREQDNALIFTTASHGATRRVLYACDTNDDRRPGRCQTEIAREIRYRPCSAMTSTYYGFLTLKRLAYLEGFPICMRAAIRLRAPAMK